MSKTKEKILLVQELINEDILIFLGRNDLMECYYTLKEYMWEDKMDIKVIKELDIKVSKHIIDKRNKEEFIIGLILNRIIEIYITEYFNNKKYVLVGSDKEKILTYNKTHYPDLLSKTDNSLLEVSSNYSLFAYNENEFALRNNKLPYLIDLSKNNKVQLIQISIPNRKYQIIEINENTKYIFKEKLPAFGYKDCYCILFEESNWKDFKIA